MTPDEEFICASITYRMDFIIQEPGKFAAGVRAFCEKYPESEYFHTAEVKADHITLKASR